MKYGACTLMPMSCSPAVALINAHVSSETRTDCTQPSSNAPSPIDLLNSIAPTDPPGFLGVPFGEPTVPKRNDEGMEPPVFMSGCGSLAIGEQRRKLRPQWRPKDQQPDDHGRGR